MNYTLEKLTSPTDCDVLIEVVEKEKDDLQYRKTTIVHQKTSQSETATEVEAELTSTTAQLTAVTTVIAGLPDGEVKNTNLIKQKRLEFKQFLLTQRKANFGAVALLESEFEQARVEAAIAEADALIAAVNARKAQL